MQNFEYYNPTRLVFGKGMIPEIARLVPKDKKVLMTYGGGSIKKNGVYEQVMEGLKDHDVLEFGGIEPNPQYATLMKAVEICRAEKVEFLLAVGGGSVLDGTKFIAAAAPFEGDEPWDICEKGAEVKQALPLGAVLTLPATGSESNPFAVVSREEKGQKLAFASELCIPAFSILDPETTFSLSKRQTRNGIVDAFVHVCEQYLTQDVNAPLQDRQSEAIMLTLLEEGPKVLKNPKDYDARANVMWCATNALSRLIGMGVPQDWSTHMIGHELTALFGLDHAQTLAVVLPANLRHRRKAKKDKLLRYAEAVWGVKGGSKKDRVLEAIDKTEEFFQSLGVKTRLKDYGVKKGVKQVARSLADRGDKLGEEQNMTEEDVLAVLDLCRE